jgi:hypothetical protein
LREIDTTPKKLFRKTGPHPTEGDRGRSEPRTSRAFVEALEPGSDHREEKRIMTTDHKSKSSKLASAKQLSTGTKKHFPNGNQQVQFAGQTHTITEVTNAIDAFVALREDTEGAQATAKAKLQAEKAQAPSLLAIVVAWVLYLKATFGTAPDVLGDFGIQPPKARRPRTAEEKAIAPAKARATREARGTKGKKAKKNVKGNVLATLVVTPLAASQPVASVSPSPAAPSAATPASPAPAAGGAAPNGGGTTPRGP